MASQFSDSAIKAMQSKTPAPGPSGSGSGSGSAPVIPTAPADEKDAKSGAPLLVGLQTTLQELRETYGTHAPAYKGSRRN
jgi:hypothetical protein